MDEIDKKILQILQENCRIQYHKIAERLGIAPSTVHFRVKRMVENGIIKSFSAIVDPEKVGYETIAWIGLSVDPRKIDEIAKKLASYDEVQIVATSTGDHDIILQAIARNEKDLWRFVNNKIKVIKGVRKDFHVSTFLDIYKRTHVIFINNKDS
ncbi:Lrp/AsnC family transcriptional regulator [Archaeoglobales archaeon]|nr:MAG: Lrp/AsnC family transcriptional regulator [Archaeoglobales archaeon]